MMSPPDSSRKRPGPQIADKRKFILDQTQFVELLNKRDIQLHVMYKRTSLFCHMCIPASVRHHGRLYIRQNDMFLNDVSMGIVIQILP